MTEDLLTTTKRRKKNSEDQQTKLAINSDAADHSACLCTSAEDRGLSN